MHFLNTTAKLNTSKTKPHDPPLSTHNTHKIWSHLLLKPYLPLLFSLLVLLSFTDLVFGWTFQALLLQVFFISSLSVWRHFFLR